MLFCSALPGNIGMNSLFLNLFGQLSFVVITVNIDVKIRKVKIKSLFYCVLFSFVIMKRFYNSLIIHIIFFMTCAISALLHRETAEKLNRAERIIFKHFYKATKSNTSYYIHAICTVSEA